MTLIINNSCNTNITLLQLKNHIEYLKKKNNIKYYNWIPYETTLHKILHYHLNLIFIEKWNYLLKIFQTLIEINLNFLLLLVIIKNNYQKIKFLH